MADINQQVNQETQAEEVSSTPVVETPQPQPQPQPEVKAPTVDDVVSKYTFDDGIIKSLIEDADSEAVKATEEKLKKQLAEKEAELTNIRLESAMKGTIPQAYAEFAKYEAQKFMNQGADPVTAVNNVYETHRQLFQAANAISGNKSDGVWPKMPPQYESPIDTKNNKENSEKQALIDSLFSDPRWRGGKK